MLTVEIHQDAIGPGETGYGLAEDCGCIMTHVCRALELPDEAQDSNYGEVGKRLGFNGATSWLRELIVKVQTEQDAAFTELVKYKGSPEVARNHMRAALRAAEKLGVKVKWLHGRPGKLERYLQLLADRRAFNKEYDQAYG